MTPNEKRDEVRELLESWGILAGYDVLLSELVDEIMLICLEVKDGNRRKPRGKE